jgi:hypothetical protein
VTRAPQAPHADALRRQVERNEGRYPKSNFIRYSPKVHMDKKRIEGLFSPKRVRPEFVDAPRTDTILITRRGENNFMVKGSHEASDVVLSTN